MSPDTVENEAPIVGAWRLVSFQSQKDNGAVTYPFGEDVKGTIIYTAHGRFAVQLMRGARPRFADPDQMKGTAEEIKTSFEGCIAYFGHYELQAEAGFVIHHIEGSLFPNWEGQPLKRYCQITGDRLQLTTPPTVWGGGGQIVGLLEWQRIK